MLLMVLSPKVSPLLAVMLTGPPAKFRIVLVIPPPVPPIVPIENAPEAIMLIPPPSTLIVDPFPNSTLAFGPEALRNSPPPSTVIELLPPAFNPAEPSTVINTPPLVFIAPGPASWPEVIATLLPRVNPEAAPNIVRDNEVLV